MTATALDGVGRLGDPAALPDVIPHLDSKHEEIRTAAARSLPWLSRLDSLAALRSALQHSDEKVKSLAALGLA